MNMLALLGWNPGTEQEIFSLEDLIRQFGLERVGRSGSRFDPDKARWFNHQYLVTRNDTELALEFQEVLKEKGVTAETAKVVKIIGLVKERVDFISQVWEQSSFFFTPPDNYDEKTLQKKWKEDTSMLLTGLMALLGSMSDFRADKIKAAAEAYATEKGVGMGQIILPPRICLVGGSFGPDLFTICELLGKEEVLSRMEKALKEIPGIIA